MFLRVNNRWRQCQLENNHISKNCFIAFARCEIFIFENFSVSREISITKKQKVWNAFHHLRNKTLQFSFRISKPAVRTKTSEAQQVLLKVSGVDHMFRMWLRDEFEAIVQEEKQNIKQNSTSKFREKYNHHRGSSPLCCYYGIKAFARYKCKNHFFQKNFIK